MDINEELKSMESSVYSTSNGDSNHGVKVFVMNDEGALELYQDMRMFKGVVSTCEEPCSRNVTHLEYKVLDTNLITRAIFLELNNIKIPYKNTFLTFKLMRKAIFSILAFIAKNCTTHD